MSTKCGLALVILAAAVLSTGNGYAKDISGGERGHRRLNEYISHYETLSYDEQEVHTSHRRAKRSVTKDHHVNLKFKAHGRDFHIRLKRDLSTFSDSLEVHSTNGPVPVDTSHIYNGEVLGEKDSLVFGSVIDGVFEGKIITERDAYYVENAKHYFPNHTQKADGFHSVIYHEKHVEDPYKDVREGHVGGCGITEEVSQWMENIQNSAVEDTESQPEQLPTPMSTEKMNKQKTKSHPPKKFSANDEFKYPHEKYSREANFRDDSTVEVKVNESSGFGHNKDDRSNIQGASEIACESTSRLHPSPKRREQEHVLTVHTNRSFDLATH